jgi:hypothetical protein
MDTTTDWTAMSDAQLVDALTTCGTDVPAGLPGAVRDRGEAIVPLLGALLLLPEDEADEDEEWGQIHALHLLGAIGSPAAAPFVVGWLRADPQTDYATEMADAALGRLGPGAIETLAAGIRDCSINPVLRNVIMDGLVQIGFHNPDARTRIADEVVHILRELRDDPDRETTAYLADATSPIDDERVRKEAATAIEILLGKPDTGGDEIPLEAIETDDPSRQPWWYPGVTYDFMEHFDDPGALFRMYRALGQEHPEIHPSRDPKSKAKKKRRKEQKKARRKNRR